MILMSLFVLTLLASNQTVQWKLVDTAGETWHSFDLMTRGIHPGNLQFEIGEEPSLKTQRPIHEARGETLEGSFTLDEPLTPLRVLYEDDVLFESEVEAGTLAISLSLETLIGDRVEVVARGRFPTEGALGQIVFEQRSTGQIRAFSRVQLEGGVKCQLPPGSHAFRAVADGYSTAKGLIVVERGTAHNLEVTFDRLHVVQGRVNPPPSSGQVAVVQFFDQAKPEVLDRDGSLVRIDAEGRFRIDAMEKGAYRVAILEVDPSFGNTKITFATFEVGDEPIVDVELRRAEVENPERYRVDIEGAEQIMLTLDAEAGHRLALAHALPGTTLELHGSFGPLKARGYRHYQTERVSGFDLFRVASGVFSEKNKGGDERVLSFDFE